MEAKRKEYEGNTKLFIPGLMGQDERFGRIRGVPVFTIFKDRMECVRRGVHRHTQAGISGSRKDGAYSICLSGGYEDDVDEGDIIIYTGTGGRRSDAYSSETGKQVRDQSFNHSDNAALKVSAVTGKPVRVVRKACRKSPWAPAKGFRYDGLYVVKDAFMDVGKRGYNICRYKLERLPNQPPIPKRTPV